MDEIENEQVEVADRKSKASEDAQMRADYLAAQQEDAEFRARTGEPALPIDRRARQQRPLGQENSGVISKAENPMPSLSLDPRNVMHGIDEQHEAICGPAIRAFETAYKAIEDIFTARNAVAMDATKTAAAQVLAISDYALKRQEMATKAFDSASANMAKTIGYIENQLSAPLVQEAGRGTVNDAIRAHVQKLSDGQRIGFIKAAIDKGDYVTATATLGAPPYLSGLTDELQASMTKYYHAKKSPELAERLEALKKAKDRLDNTGGRILTEVTRAVGADWDKIHKLREAKNAADRALALQSFT